MLLADVVAATDGPEGSVEMIEAWGVDPERKRENDPDPKKLRE